MADYMAELSQQIGLPNYPKQGPFGDKVGAVIGVRDGYPIAVGPSASGNQRSLKLMVRFKDVADPNNIIEALKKGPGKPSGAKASAERDFALVDWKYSFRMPKAPDVAEALRGMIETIKPLAPPLDERCEKCQGSSKQALILRNGVPGYFCDGCQERDRQELNRVAEEYENLPSNLPKGLVYGVVAGLIGSFVWGGVAYAINRIYLVGAILIGYFVGVAVAKGMGKVTRTGQVLSGLLTVASVLMGDAFYFSFVAAKVAHIPWGLRAVQWVLENFVKLESQESGLLTLVFALVGSAAAVLRVKKPKFAVKYERPGVLAS